MAKITKEDALRYHAEGRPGKIEVIPTKPYSTQYDLSLAYTPGVAEPCLDIEKNLDDAYLYTAKGNLVAVISNGTAVLGLGDIGALAGKPVMEGKGLLFKVFADVDVFDIEVNEKDPKKLIEVIKAIAPTFGGINLEDIKAPECFEVEQTLKKMLDIPVFHDDQHGTAIISAAGLLNALEITGKKIDQVKLVVNGAGASAISCSKLYVSLGMKLENIIMVDSKGVITTDRTDLNEEKKTFARNVKFKTLTEALVGADMLLGLSVGNIVKGEMIKKMAKDPIIFAMANPNPEISYEEAMAARKDLIFATGRSDYPNQINNVLGFPFIFRGALDVRAKTINEEMKIAAVKALAALTKEDVPDKVNRAYKSKNLIFGREYIIPKPLDPRLITTVAPAVARAAMESGVARRPITDWAAYHVELLKRLGLHNQLVNEIRSKAKAHPKRILFGNANNYKVLKAAQVVDHQGIGIPVLLGNKDELARIARENNLEISNIQVVDHLSPVEEERRKRYAQLLFEKRKRKGLTLDESLEKMYDQHYFGVMMVESGDTDAFLSGFSTKYSDTIRPALQICGTNNSLNHIAGMYILITKKGPFFFADTTVNIQPEGQTLVDTTLLTAREVRKFGVEPVIAFVSYSNFGSSIEGSPEREREAIRILHEKHPQLIVDGEMQANIALNKEIRRKLFPFSKLADKDVNTLIFPNLSSGNIAYKMMQEIGGAEVIGPILMGLKKPIQVLQIESSVPEIVNMAAICVVGAQTAEDTIIRF